MKYLRAILLGFVQGATEFLPVSSSGHLVLLERLGVAPPSVYFNLILHVATLFAVLVVMRREVRDMIRHPVKGDAKYVLVASLPTAAIAVMLKKYLPRLFEGSLLPFGFLLTSALLLLPCLFKGRAKGERLSLPRSIGVGCMQGIAALPGVSRSGATIVAAELMGVDPERAARFSFLLSIPAILGGFLIEGVECGFRAEGVETGEVVVASVVAFIGGLIAAKGMLRIVKKGLAPFAIYTFLLGIGCFFLL